MVGTDTYIRFRVGNSGSWSTGVQFVGDDGDTGPAGATGQTGQTGATGAAGDSVQVQYSAMESTGYHSTLATSDKYIRFRIGTSGTWSTGVKFVGDDGTEGTAGSDGDSVQIQYSSDNSNWHDTLVTSDTYIRFRVGSSGNWSTGVQFVG